MLAKSEDPKHQKSEHKSPQKRTLAALAAILCLVGAVIPAHSQQRDPVQYETGPALIERNNSRSHEMPVAVPQSQSDWKVYYMRADKLRLAGNFNAALRDFDLAQALNPNAYEIYLGKARTYDKMGMYQRVIANYDQAIAMHPRQEQVWLERAGFFLRQNKMPQAARDLEEGLRYLPNSPNLYVARGALYFQRKAYGRALSDADAALQRNPSMFQAHQLKTDSLLMMNDYAAYEMALSDMLSHPQYQQDAELYFSRALARFELKRISPAIEDLDQTLKLQPKAHEALHLRGDLLMRQAKAQPEMCAFALKDLKAACKLGNKQACSQLRKPSCKVPPKPKATPKPVAPAAEAEAPAAPAPQSAPAAAPASPTAPTSPSAPMIKP
ncbi:MAG: hypothetical protein CVV27_03505 [Candidatus Melainabacteria bacterium HGW-Melainabacteria-1]|nr:MAG: hypothetical protein CVV27_03505 [Candidatus Melainabacteria bacterium HGW-Melainabacteria-1]